MNILREISRGGKGKSLNAKSSNASDFGSMAAAALHEPNVDTKKVILFICELIITAKKDSFEIENELQLTTKLALYF